MDTNGHRCFAQVQNKTRVFVMWVCASVHTCNRVHSKCVYPTFNGWTDVCVCICVYESYHVCKCVDVCTASVFIPQDALLQSRGRWRGMAVPFHMPLKTAPRPCCSPWDTHNSAQLTVLQPTFHPVVAHWVLLSTRVRSPTTCMPHRPETPHRLPATGCQWCIVSSSVIPASHIVYYMIFCTTYHSLATCSCTV